MNNLIVCNTIVREDLEDRYCLNDLHKASGNNPKDKPSNWLRSDKTKEFIEELQQFSETRSVIEAVNGGIEPGTYAIKEIVYAYAMWISPKFQVQVIRAYDDMVNGNPYIKASRKELLKLAYEHEEKIEMLKEQVEYLEPFKEKVDNSMAIFPTKESTDEGERVYKKYLKEKYPFIGNNSITNILEYYTKYKYKETKSYLKTEVDTAIKEFFDTCSYDISEQKLTVIIKHDCLLSGQMQVKKEHAINYLNYTEEDFE